MIAPVVGGVQDGVNEILAGRIAAVELAVEVVQLGMRLGMSGIQRIAVELVMRGIQLAVRLGMGLIQSCMQGCLRGWIAAVKLRVENI